MNKNLTNRLKRLEERQKQDYQSVIARTKAWLAEKIKEQQESASTR